MGQHELDLDQGLLRIELSRICESRYSPADVVHANQDSQDVADQVRLHEILFMTAYKY